MIYQVPLQALKLWNPFQSHVWSGLRKPLTVEEISRAIKAKKFESRLIDTNGCRKQHIRRIAYLVENPSNDPIQIDIGVPELGFNPTWPIIDGNHRLAASFYRNDKTIPAEISGSLDYIELLLKNKLE